jgi:hypothetical protein
MLAMLLKPDGLGGSEPRGLRPLAPPGHLKVAYNELFLEKMSCIRKSQLEHGKVGK